MEKGITFILTLYKPKKTEIDYWGSFFKEIEIFENLDYFILVDNPDFKFEEKVFKDEKVFLNKFNKGKFSTVYDFLKRMQIKTTHIKICDPDDQIDLNLMLSKIDDLDVEKISIMKQKKIEKDGKIREYEINSFATSSTILPYHALFFDSLYSESFEIRNWFEDQIFGILAFIGGCSIKKLPYSWYLYDMSHGITKNKKSLDDFEEIYNACKVAVDLVRDSGLQMSVDFPADLEYAKKMIKDSLVDKKTIDHYISKIDELSSKVK